MCCLGMVGATGAAGLGTYHKISASAAEENAHKLRQQTNLIKVRS